MTFIFIKSKVIFRKNATGARPRANLCNNSGETEEVDNLTVLYKFFLKVLSKPQMNVTNSIFCDQCICKAYPLWAFTGCLLMHGNTLGSVEKISCQSLHSFPLTPFRLQSSHQNETQQMKNWPRQHLVN